MPNPKEIQPPTGKTFENFDKLDLQRFANKLESFIRTEQALVDDSLVISLNAPFGYGKSAFLEMWHEYLLRRCKLGDAVPLPIILNAWESDHCGDPLLALIDAVSRAVMKYKGNANAAEVKKWEEAIKDIAWFGASLANGVLEAQTGLDPLNSIETVRDKKMARAERRQPVDILQAYRMRSEALQALKISLRKVFTAEKASAIIMVDELDRCRPDYAIEYLETIKHVFDIRGIVFVLAVDKHHLKTSAQALYGANLKFDEYYRKFVSRNIPLPRPTEQSNAHLIQHYFERFIQFQVEETRKRHSSFKLYGSFTDHVATLVSGLDSSPRQTQEALRLLGHLGENNLRNFEVTTGYTFCSVFMAFLAVCRPDAYHSFGTKYHNFQFSAEQVRLLLPKENVTDWWIPMIGIAALDTSQDGYDHQLWLDLRGLHYLAESDDQPKAKKWIMEFGTFWQNSQSRGALIRIYDLIEGLKQFGGL